MTEVVLQEYSPADVMRQLCIDLNVGQMPGGSVEWPIFVSAEPNEPDECITIYNTSGELHGRHMITGEVQEFPGIMFRVRATTESANPLINGHRVGWKKINEIVKKMDESVLSTLVTILDTNGQTQFKVHSASRRGTVLDGGRPPVAGNRQIYTVNYVVSVEYINPTS